MKKIAKSLGAVIGAYILIQILVMPLLGGAGGAMGTVVNLLFTCILLLAIFSLILGGGNGGPLRGISRGIWLVVGLICFTILLSVIYGGEGGLIKTFVSDVVPFGRIYAAIFGWQSISASWAVGFGREFAKLFLQMILYIIIYRLVLMFLFSEEWENDPEQPYKNTGGELLARFSFKGILAAIFGRIYSAYIAAFIFTMLIILLERNLGAGELVVSIVLSLLSLGLFLLARFLPFLALGVTATATKTVGSIVVGKLLFGMLKTFVINTIAVIILFALSG